MTSELVTYKIGQYIVKTYARLFLSIRLKKEPLLFSTPRVIVANHPSTTDPFLMPILFPEKLSILIHRSVFTVPLFGWYLKKSGHIPVDPHHGQEAFAEALERLKNGHSIVVFVEGKLSPKTGYGRPHTGAVRLALAAGVPIIPVGFHVQKEKIKKININLANKKDRMLWYLGRNYWINIGQSIPPTGSVENRILVKDKTKELMSKIKFLARQT